MSRWTKENFKYKIGDKINGNTIIGYTSITSGFYKNGTPARKKGYIVMCKKYNRAFKIRETKDMSKIQGPYQNGKTVIKENSLGYNYPHLLSFLKYPKESFKVTSGSNKDILQKCPKCLREKMGKVSDLTNWGFTCKYCTNNLSFGSKYMRVLLIENNIDFEPEYNIPNLLSPKGFNVPFDIYLKDYNILIEIMGAQHYIEKGYGIDLEDRKEMDKYKKEQAIKLGYNYIAIDAVDSTVEYIRNNIEKTELINIVDLNINKVHKKIQEMYFDENLDAVKEMDSKGYSMQKISEELKISDAKVSSDLKRLGLYKRTKTRRKGKIRCITTGKIFNSQKEACEEYGVNKSNLSMTLSCKYNRKYAGTLNNEPLSWEYVD